MPGQIITKSGKEDLAELIDMYISQSDGIMLSAMDILPSSAQSFLSEEYKKAGLKREIQWLSVKKYGELKAIAMVSISDAGLNLSNLTNCIYFFVIDQNNFSREEFLEALQELAGLYIENDIQAMVYPLEYAVKKEICFEKTYNLWVLDVPRAVDKFYKFMYSIFKRKKQ